jgi:hypothetical protein
LVIVIPHFLSLVPHATYFYVLNSLPGSNRSATAQSRLGTLIGVDLDSPAKSKFSSSSSSSSLLLGEGLGRDILGGSYFSPTLETKEVTSFTSNLGIPSPPRDSQIQTLLERLNIGDIQYVEDSEESTRYALRTQQDAASQSVFSKLGIQANSPDRAQRGDRNSRGASSRLLDSSNPDSGTFLNDLRGKTKANSTFVFSGSDASTPSASKTSTLQVSNSFSVFRNEDHYMYAFFYVGVLFCEETFISRDVCIYKVETYEHAAKEENCY